MKLPSIYSGFCLYFLMFLFLFLFKKEGNTLDTLRFDSIGFLPVSGKLVASDPLGFFFVLNENGTLLKMDSLGKEQFRYSTTRVGQLQAVDTYNGLQILCWFPDFQKIIILDRTLQPQGEINLPQQGIFRSMAVKTALDGNIWVFDDNNFQIKKLDRFGKEIMAGNRLDLVLESPWHPVYLVEYENKVYLTDPDKGILVLDVFGNYLKTLPLTGIRHFFIHTNKMYFRLENAFKSFNLNALLEETVKADLDQTLGMRLYWEGKYCFAFFKDKIQIFTFQAN